MFVNVLAQFISVVPLAGWLRNQKINAPLPDDMRPATRAALFIGISAGRHAEIIHEIIAPIVGVIDNKFNVIDALDA